MLVMYDRSTSLMRERMDGGGGGDLRSFYLRAEHADGVSGIVIAGEHGGATVVCEWVEE